jgi:ADP-heptose:LPS heptosyltransferase
MSHLAVAVGTSSVVLFTVSDPDRWAPLDRNRHRIVATRAAGADAADDEGQARAIAHCDELLALPR